jgi:uncharacterized protein involved in type VI secretion and phage assembly
MTPTLFETVRRIAQEELRQIRTAELAVVKDQHSHESASDNDNYACDVELRNSGLALKKVPVATGQVGAVNIPAVGDLVLVQFIGGDVNAPVIVGRFYNDQDRPPVNKDGQWVLHLPLGAGASDAVDIQLQSGDTRTIQLKLGDGLSIQLQDDDPAVEIDVSGGKAKLTIGKDGAVTLESQGDINVKGNQITIEAQGQLNLKGATVNLN